MTLVSDIKLIRTDTTLDLSQKAEKGLGYTKQSPRRRIPPSDPVSQRLPKIVCPAFRVVLSRAGPGTDLVAR
ncbi:hypothetical protein MARPO_0058s0060, partial [Marchantia polymorpha]